ncbi:ceramide synthase 2-like isoform X2 [Biomphalaria glabrata]|uniref:Ceramide synthase 2-like isoform X2 n=1 Tax=Biomphalaria glabrata TaxID=6526 RepID=A0A9W3BJ18_BIOGL|nr:ceramide synthase 2-like isoform X2 [Biomphalaria glabrata]
MADIWNTVYEFVWSEQFWLAGNYTWDVLKNTDNGIYHPQIADLLTSVYLSIVVYTIRILFERYIFGPIGHSFGLKAIVKKAAPVPILENAFKQKKSPSNEILQHPHGISNHRLISSLAKQTDMTVRQVERWFRIRRNQERTPVFKKFCESSWRGLFYFFIFWYGVYLHLDKVWFYETMQAWAGWPHHHITNDVYWYYMIEAAFYISLLFSLFTDNKRKDFTEMVIHHVATLLLMFMSWTNNFVRIGTLVLLVHDAVDFWMESAKVAKYLGYDKLCERLFFIFMVVWVLTRMILFPFRIIRSTMFEAPTGIGIPTVGWCTMWSVYNFLLCILQVLHIIWFYYICLIAKDAFRGQDLYHPRNQKKIVSKISLSTTIILHCEGAIDQSFRQRAILCEFLDS